MDRIPNNTSLYRYEQFGGIYASECNLLCSQKQENPIIRLAFRKSALSTFEIKLLRQCWAALANKRLDFIQISRRPQIIGQTPYYPYSVNYHNNTSIYTSQLLPVRPTFCPTDNGDSKLVH